MIEDLVENAKEELKRADHSIFVSLKYIRTADIIKSIIKRFISAYEMTFDDILHHLKKSRKIKEIPNSIVQKTDLVKGKLPQLKEEIEFYYLLRNIDKARYERHEEYKKNVALIAYVQQKKVSVNIEILRQYFEKAVLFVNMVDELVHKKSNKSKK